MKYVYVVTSGVYADYSIVEVFSTPEAANQLVAQDSEYQVEVWEVDPAGVAPGDGLKAWEVLMASQGRRLVVETSPGTGFREVYPTYEQNGQGRSCTTGYLATRVYSDTASRALAIAEDRLSQYLCTSPWPRVEIKVVVQWQPRFVVEVDDDEVKT